MQIDLTFISGHQRFGCSTLYCPCGAARDAAPEPSRLMKHDAHDDSESTAGPLRRSPAVPLSLTGDLCKSPTGWATGAPSSRRGKDVWCSPARSGGGTAPPSASCGRPWKRAPWDHPTQQALVSPGCARGPASWRPRRGGPALSGGPAKMCSETWSEPGLTVRRYHCRPARQRTCETSSLILCTSQIRTPMMPLSFFRSERIGGLGAAAPGRARLALITTSYWPPGSRVHSRRCVFSSRGRRSVQAVAARRRREASPASAEDEQRSKLAEPPYRSRHTGCSKPAQRPATPRIRRGIRTGAMIPPPQCPHGQLEP